MRRAPSWLEQAAFAAPARSLEARAALGAGAAGVLLALTISRLGDLQLSWWGWAILALIAFDLFGGIAANATLAAGRRRPGAGRWRPVAFAAAHLQPLVLAWLNPEYGWLSALGLWTCALTGVMICAAPPRIKLSIALVYCVVATSWLAGAGAAAGLEWLAPAFLTKLVAAHAVVHAGGQGQP
jgi:hypothetical protein